MGYFNFYIIKKIINLFFNYIRKYKKFIIIFIIFVCILFIKEKCFAVTYPYDSDHYIEWYSPTTYNGTTIRVTSDTDFMLVPNKVNPRAINVYNIYTGEIINASIYFNGNFRSDVYGSTILTGDSFYNYTPQLTTKGRYVAFTYNPSLDSIYEFSSNCPPFIYNLQNTIDWSFTDLQICFGDTITIYTHPERWRITLIIQHNGVNYNYNINNYLGTITYRSSPNVQNPWSYDFKYDKAEVPKYNILQDVVLKKNDVIRFYVKTEYSTDNFTNNIITDTYNLGSINYGASANDEINNNLGAINNNLTNINNSVQQTTDAVEDNTQAVEDNTQAIEHLEDTITDPTVESSANDLPSTDVTDPTATGIDNIFQSIYNAFCVGQAQDIVFPIPFTNKNITLSPYYVSDMLNNNGAGWVYTLIQAFWGYLIGRFIISDISKKIDKIKSGNIENVENSNIKEEML